jgi:hypothetical protein
MAITRAYIIKGDNEAIRRKTSEMIRGEVMLMYSIQPTDKTATEVGILFADKHADFVDLTLDRIREAAGETVLPADLRISTFGSEARFGVIDLGDM